MKKMAVLLTIMTLVISYVSFSSLNISMSSFKSVIFSSSIKKNIENNTGLIGEEIETRGAIEERLDAEEIKSFLLLGIKFFISLILGGAALFVILSKKYNEETQKWAFSVLSLISGVWIGTIS